MPKREGKDHQGLLVKTGHLAPLAKMARARSTSFGSTKDMALLDTEATASVLDEDGDDSTTNIKVVDITQKFIGKADYLRPSDQRASLRGARDQVHEQLPGQGGLAGAHIVAMESFAPCHSGRTG